MSDQARVRLITIRHLIIRIDPSLRRLRRAFPGRLASRSSFTIKLKNEPKGANPVSRLERSSGGNLSGSVNRRQTAIEVTSCARNARTDDSPFYPSQGRPVYAAPALLPQGHVRKRLNLMFQVIRNISDDSPSYKSHLSGKACSGCAKFCHHFAGTNSGSTTDDYIRRTSAHASIMEQQAASIGQTTTRLTPEPPLPLLTSFGLPRHRIYIDGNRDAGRSISHTPARRLHHDEFPRWARSPRDELAAIPASLPSIAVARHQHSGGGF